MYEDEPEKLITLENFVKALKVKVEIFKLSETPNRSQVTALNLVYD
jgi:hypothetical protein